MIQLMKLGLLISIVVSPAVDSLKCPYECACSAEGGGRVRTECVKGLYSERTFLFYGLTKKRVSEVIILRILFVYEF